VKAAEGGTISTTSEALSPLPPELVVLEGGTQAAPAGRRHKLTEYGNAERLIDKFGEDIRYIPGLGWHVWDGRYWARDASAAVLCMKRTARAIWGETKATNDWDEQNAIVKWAKTSEKLSTIRSSLTLASTEPGIALAADDLDRDPWLFNVANGTLDLRSGELREHRRSDLATCLSPVVYDPDAYSATWEDFLLEACGGNAELVGFLRRSTGYSLTGLTTEEKLFFAHGPGGTGKSTFLEALKGVFGAYSRTTDFETFTKKKGDAGIRNDIARLAGARMVISSEIDEGKALAEAVVKQLTGGDTVAARFLFKELFEFKPQFKLWFAANSRPAVDATDSGMWRRILQIPFVVVVPPAKQDKELKKKLRHDPAMQSAILAWAVQGCLEWQEYGLQPPHSVTAYTQEYRNETDPLSDFFDEQCIFEAAAADTRNAVRDRHRQWAWRNHTEAASDKKLAASLRARGVTEGPKIQGKRAWHGVRLIGADPPTNASGF
jgi:putative DNA primase/helicase